MTDQATAQTTAQQPSQPAPAKHDTLAVLAFIFGILLWPLGIYLGHASCQEAVLAGRKRSALALAGMTWHMTSGDLVVNGPSSALNGTSPQGT